VLKRILTTLAMSVTLVLLIALPGVSLAQEPVTHAKDEVVVKATIDGIDHDTRVITFKDKDGNSWDVVAGPEVRRFDELKVGDVVTFRTTEATVYQVRKPGEAAAPSAKDAPAIVRTPGAKPGGVKTEQETKVVTIKEVNQKTKGVTIQTEDGKTMSMKVEDSKLLKGLAAGDRVVITYTKAVAISIE
jgi:Cu/Ag efflux protein CusF